MRRCLMRKAITMEALLDLPIWQCTNTFPSSSCFEMKAKAGQKCSCRGTSLLSLALSQRWRRLCFSIFKGTWCCRYYCSSKTDTTAPILLALRMAPCKLPTDPRNKWPFSRRASWLILQMRLHLCELNIVQILPTGLFLYTCKTIPFDTSIIHRVLMPRPLKHISETPQAVIMGNTRFRPITSKERKFVEKNKKYWTNQREWPIDYGKFDKHHWKETMDVIEETAIENLWLNDNKSKEVLRCLVTPKFTRLTILNLNSNLLTSAQAICRIRAPCIQRLELKDNQISDVRAFRKTCFRNLSQLSIMVNWSVLSELYAPHLQRLSFQRKPFPFLDESVDWLLRMQAKQFKRVDALSFRRIPQQAVRSAIGQRYSGLAMEWSTV